MSSPEVIIDPYCLYEIPKVTHFQWIRLRKRSAKICLSFKLVIEKRFQIKITGAVKELGKYSLKKVKCSPNPFTGKAETLWNGS